MASGARALQVAQRRPGSKAARHSSVNPNCSGRSGGSRQPPTAPLATTVASGQRENCRSCGGEHRIVQAPTLARRRRPSWRQTQCTVQLTGSGGGGLFLLRFAAGLGVVAAAAPCSEAEAAAAAQVSSRGENQFASKISKYSLAISDILANERTRAKIIANYKH